MRDDVLLGIRTIVMEITGVKKLKTHEASHLHSGLVGDTLRSFE